MRTVLDFRILSHNKFRKRNILNLRMLVLDNLRKKIIHNLSRATIILDNRNILNLRILRDNNPQNSSIPIEREPIDILG